MDETFFPILLLLFTLFRVVSGEDWCYTRRHGYYTYEYCSKGCCDESCCDVDIGLIVGATIGGLLFIGFLIFIICIFYHNKKRTHGRVIAPATTTTVHYTTATIGHVPQPPPYHLNQPHQPQGYGYGQAYPAHAPPSYPPPQQSDPAYPPAPAVYTSGGQQT